MVCFGGVWRGGIFVLCETGLRGEGFVKGSWFFLGGVGWFAFCPGGLVDLGGGGDFWGGAIGADGFVCC